MTKPTFRYTCSSASVTLLHYIYDHSRKISFRTFMNSIDKDSLDDLDLLRCYAKPGERGLKLKDDPYVSYFKSKLPNGKICYNMEHSCIDHIFY